VGAIIFVALITPGPGEQKREHCWVSTPDSKLPVPQMAWFFSQSVAWMVKRGGVTIGPGWEQSSQWKAHKECISRELSEEGKKKLPKKQNSENTHFPIVLKQKKEKPTLQEGVTWNHRRGYNRTKEIKRSCQVSGGMWEKQKPL
jgi:hypothetical protein